MRDNKNKFFFRGYHTYHLSDLFFDENDYNYQFDYCPVSDNLKLMMIKDVYHQILTKHPSYQKIIIFIILNS